jgi:hypothetical protein
MEQPSEQRYVLMIDILFLALPEEERRREVSNSCHYQVSCEYEA